MALPDPEAPTLILEESDVRIVDLLAGSGRCVELAAYQDEAVDPEVLVALRRAGIDAAVVSQSMVVA